MIVVRCQLTGRRETTLLGLCHFIRSKGVILPCMWPQFEAVCVCEVVCVCACVCVDVYVCMHAQVFVCDVCAFVGVHRCIPVCACLRV
jgi:hypothetical protein